MRRLTDIRRNCARAMSGAYKISTMQVVFVLGGCLLATFAVIAAESQEVPVLYDVTTIYRLDEPLPESNQGFSHFASLSHPGVMEVHARTNARGLPFLLRNGSTISPNVGVDLPECLMSLGASSYQMNNFTMLDISFAQTPIISPGSEYYYEYEIGRNEHSTTLKACHGRNLQLEFKVEENSPDMSSSELLVFLVEPDISSLKSTIHLLRFIYSSNGCILYKCVSRLFKLEGIIEDEPFDPQQVPDGCKVVMTATYPWYFSKGENISINTEMSGRSLVVTIASPRQAATKVFDWDGQDPSINITHFAIGTKLFSGIVTGKSWREDVGLVMNQPTGSVVSPPLPTDLDSICVVLFFYADGEVDIDLSLQRDGAITPIGRIQTQAAARGEWTHRTFVTDLPATSGREARVVAVVTKSAGVTVVIKRLAGCNAADPEDVLELPADTVNATGQGVDVAYEAVYRLSKTNECTNGGLQVGWVDDVTRESPLCICPPGFTGNKCSEGCGANSYGADCGGVCSGSKRGCRGMVLCKPAMKCDCAPGYQGFYCDKACDRGEYGTGCSQRCGRCAGEPCDTYTGICYQGCEPGYAPPYCKQTYSYPSLPPQVTVLDFYNVSVSGNLKALQGHGVPLFYQIQYKVNGTTVWHQEVPRPIPEEMAKSSPRSTVDLGNVTGLDPGTDYALRVVTIHQSLGSYEGPLVPTVVVSTPCIVPGDADYGNEATSKKFLRSTLVEQEGFEVEWKFPSSNVTWCPVIGYEVRVKIDWRWMSHTLAGDVTRHHVTGLLPGRQYTVRVRGVTGRGAAAVSEPLVVTTLERAPDHVVDLKATPIAKRSLKVSWKPPKHPAGTIRHYHVTYQCLHLGACPQVNCDDSAGQVDVSSTSHLIEGLVPFAVYNISVAGLSGFMGSVSSVLAATLQSEPDVMPASVSPAVLSRSNSSIAVQWGSPNNCREGNGYITGYRYELLPPGRDVPVFVGTTPEHSVSFDNLSPHAEYVIRIYVTTSVGWTASKPLVITAFTRATSPEIVENLAVYKRGRRMLGLRWSPPRITSGSLESFTVSHRTAEGSQDPVSETISPTPCPAWPRLFCHTIRGLKQDTDYTITVKARNSEVNVDGETVAVNATTRESAPTAPTFLRLLNRTDVTMNIEWGLPDLVNGQLRSFLVNVEETDSHNSSDCCQYFPIREVIVSSERPGYEFQMTGLKPASSYEVSLSAKTVAMGPAVTLTVHTRPPTPVLGQAPKLAEQPVVGTPLRVRVEPAADHGDLVSGYLLLLKENSSVEPSPIKDEWLATQLKQALNGSFSLVAEFTKGNMPEGGVVNVSPGRPMVDGIYGTVGLGALKPDTQYQLVLALVFEYCKALSVGHITGEPFTLKHA